ncbi:hypothetical protein T492DRAFT_985723 [Pavlovales sp. CCMP2436]|nr:hypothetical protein T492DRAFT_985723 [Pavlovales sp. CCMP2436]|mmetsp:Transcript_15242/g.38630  ORF Transcript_15242/g.38630 Transcript_15242/m.38630 type:complete len:304 (+) Transcript_15242:107-1018(+)
MRRASSTGRRPRPDAQADPYYDHPPFSHGGYGLGAMREGAGHLPRALWAPNRLLANHEAALERAHHERRVSGATALVPKRRKQPGSRAAPRPLEVVVFPREEVGQASRVAYHVNGRACASLELVRDQTYVFDQSHFSNLGDDGGSFALCFFEDLDGSGYTSGVSTSVAPPGVLGAHVVFHVGRGTPSMLYYGSTLWAKAHQVDGGLTLVRDAETRPASSAASEAAGPRHKPQGIADALAEHQARVAVNARLLAQRDLRHRVGEEQLGRGLGGHEYGATGRRPVWNSRPRDAHHWIGGLPRGSA